MGAGGRVRARKRKNPGHIRGEERYAYAEKEEEARATLEEEKKEIRFLVQLLSLRGGPSGSLALACSH